MSREWIEKDVVRDPKHAADTINRLFASAGTSRAEIKQLRGLLRSTAEVMSHGRPGHLDDNAYRKWDETLTAAEAAGGG